LKVNQLQQATITIKQMLSADEMRFLILGMVIATAQELPVATCPRHKEHRPVA